jgi:NDP-sugar pyrophosphorylase family protein
MVTSPTAHDDAPLLMLEAQFNALTAELTTAQRANRESCPDQRSFVQHGVWTDIDAPTDHEARTRQVEAILARLDPIEQAIMATPARTIAGLGVKARHAAYVTSQYWSEPIDKIDWEARAVQLLIEAVCNVAHVPLLLDGANGPNSGCA